MIEDGQQITLENLVEFIRQEISLNKDRYSIIIELEIETADEFIVKINTKRQMI